MRAERLKLSIFAPNKFCDGRTVNCFENPHYAYTWPLAATIEKPTDNKDSKWERHYEE